MSNVVGTFTVKIEMDMEALLVLIKERDGLMARVARLESEPLAFSLKALSNRVRNNLKGYTPDQLDRVCGLIEEG